MVISVSEILGFIRAERCGAVQGFRGDGINSFSIDLKKIILEITAPFMHTEAT